MTIPDIKMTKIKMGTDGRYPRAMKIDYQVEGSSDYSYVYYDFDGQKDKFESMNYDFQYNEFVTRVDLWKVGSELQQVDIYIDSKNK